VPRTQRNATWRCAAEPEPILVSLVAFWVPVLRSSAYALQRARDTRYRLPET